MEKYYARINSLTSKVDNVISADEFFIKNRMDYDLWVETSVEMTKKFASIGDVFNSIDNTFIGNSPYASWMFNKDKWEWEAPVAYPDDDKMYDWDEETTSWVETEEN